MSLRLEEIFQIVAQDWSRRDSMITARGRFSLRRLCRVPQIAKLAEPILRCRFRSGRSIVSDAEM